LTQAIALVVDGFFRDLGQTPTLDVTAPPQPAPSATAPEMAATPLAAPAVQTKPVSPPVTEPSLTPARSGNQFRLGWVLGTGYESAVRSAAVDLGWFGATTSGWRFALHGSVPFSQYSEAVTPGKAELFAVPIRLSAMRQLDLTSELNVFIGPELLLSVERGWTHGLVSERKGYRATWGLGGQLGAAYSLWSRGGLAIRLSGDRVIADASAFTVEGESVLTLPRLRWSVALQLWGLVF
jgi:hypothetical protein